MGIQLNFTNIKGNEHTIHAPCFGVLTGIGKWNKSCDCDLYDDDEWCDDCEPLPDFSSSELVTMKYKARENGVCKDLASLSEQIPWLFGKVTYDGEFFHIPCDSDTGMEQTIMAGMMLRNTHQYAPSTLKHLMREGFSVKTSFIISQYLNVYHRIGQGDQVTLQADNDGSILRLGSFINGEDLRYFCNVGQPYSYQGKWGDTVNGYGRYESYNGEVAPRHPRTRENSSLRDCCLLPESIESPRLIELWKKAVNEVGRSDNIKVASVLAKLLEPYIEGQ